MLRPLVLVLRQLMEEQSASASLVPGHYLEGPTEHRERMTKFAQDLGNFKLHPEKPNKFIGGGVIGASDLHLQNGTRVIAKTIDHQVNSIYEIDPSRAARRHTAIHRIAHEVGAGHLILPAAHIENPEEINISSEGERSKARTKKISPGQKVFVTEHAGENYAPLSVMEKTNRDKISDEDRVLGGFLHAVSGNTDGHEGNVMIDHDGNMKLIDHDYSFSGLSNRTNVGRLTYSTFHPQEGWIPYEKKQSSVEDLPEKPKNFVHENADKPVEHLSQKYDLDHEDANILKKQVDKIKSNGLTHAFG